MPRRWEELWFVTTTCGLPGCKVSNKIRMTASQKEVHDIATGKIEGDLVEGPEVIWYSLQTSGWSRGAELFCSIEHAQKAADARIVREN